MPFDTPEIRFETDFRTVDWGALREALIRDNFDNGRTPEEYERSARNSFANIYVYAGERIIGNARVLSDGVCNAYLVDVWVDTDYRRRGIASEMVGQLLDKLNGQHVYLFTDDMQPFYESIGFCAQPTGMSIVVGNWLGRSEPSDH